MNRNLFKAQKDYICEHCRKIIHEGEQYADYSYNTKQADGVSWHHYRYHLECDNREKVEKVPEPPKDGRALYERIQDKLNKEGAFPMANKDNIKLWVCGIVYEEEGPKYVMCRDWVDRKAYFVSMNTAKSFHDYNGEKL